MPLIATSDIVGTRFNRRHHNRIRIPGCGRVNYFTRTFKHKTNGACFTQITAVFSKSRPHS